MTRAVRARIVALGAVLAGASFLVLWGAEPLGVVAATSVVLVGPSSKRWAGWSRGRVLTTLATGVAPLLYAWLLDRGSGAAWLGLTGIALLGGLATVPMRRGSPRRPGGHEPGGEGGGLAPVPAPNTWPTCLARVRA